MELVLTLSNDRPRTQKEMQQADMQQLQDQLRGAPGVSGVATAPWAIFEGSSWTEQVFVPGNGPSDREEIFYGVSPGYFATCERRYSKVSTLVDKTGRTASDADD